MTIYLNDGLLLNYRKPEKAIDGCNQDLLFKDIQTYTKTFGSWQEAKLVKPCQKKFL